MPECTNSFFIPAKTGFQDACSEEDGLKPGARKKHLSCRIIFHRLKPGKWIKYRKKDALALLACSVFPG